jgi:hypothetical protein
MESERKLINEKKLVKEKKRYNRRIFQYKCWRYVRNSEKKLWLSKKESC